MENLNYIDFENPEMTPARLPHSHCMIYKPKKELKQYNLSNVDIISSNINQEHLDKVRKAKEIKNNL